MEIKKVLVDGKEIEVYIKDSIQLSDTELNGVQGGVTIPRDKPIYELVCDSCGWKSAYYTESGEKKIQVGIHMLSKLFHINYTERTIN